MRQSLFCLIFRKILFCRFFVMSKQPFDLSYLKTHSTTRLSCCQCLIGNGFVSQWERESLFLTLVRMTGLVVSKANVIAKRANLFATVERLRKTNCACRTTVLCTDTTCFICLLCSLRSMAANALLLRLSSLAVCCMAGQVANKVCRQCNLHCRKSVTAV